MNVVRLGGLGVSRFVLGTNPVAGHSHQGKERDAVMRRYFTTANVKKLFREAEKLGVRTVIARCDHHIERLFLEYWDEGGKIDWIAQTAPEYENPARAIDIAIRGGAKACFLHGGTADFLHGKGRFDDIRAAVDTIRGAGLAVGIGGHRPEVHEWARENLTLDFSMCSYYNPTSRDEKPDHVSGIREWFKPEDRDRMAKTIRTLPWPAIHYKVMAAGRNKPEEAFDYVAKTMRPGDACCVGIYSGDDRKQFRRTLSIFEKSLTAVGKA